MWVLAYSNARESPIGNLTALSYDEDIGTGCSTTYKNNAKWQHREREVRQELYLYHSLQFTKNPDLMSGFFITYLILITYKNAHFYAMIYINGIY